MPKDHDEEVNATKAVYILREWVKPIAAAICIGVGLYYRMQWDLEEIKKHGMVNHARLIEETRSELRRKSHFGPDGFDDPEIAAGLNAHIDRRLEARGFKPDSTRREFWRRFQELNRTLNVPKE
jgi:hypothetical protein